MIQSVIATCLQVVDIYRLLDSAVISKKSFNIHLDSHIPNSFFLELKTKT